MNVERNTFAPAWDMGTLIQKKQSSIDIEVCDIPTGTESMLIRLHSNVLALDISAMHILLDCQDLQKTSRVCAEGTKLAERIVELIANVAWSQVLHEMWVRDGMGKGDGGVVGVVRRGWRVQDQS